MIFAYIIAGVLLLGIINFIVAKRFFLGPQDPISEARSTLVSYSIESETDAERAFFDTETRINLFWQTKDGITSFYLDDQLTQLPLNGYYCDGFFVISIVDHGMSFKELI